MNLPPYYPTVKGITDYAVWQLVYPDSLLKADIAGEAVCTLRIDSLGIVRSKYIEATHPLFAKAAEDVIEGMREWQPAKKAGRDIDSTVVFHIPFNPDIYSDRIWRQQQVLESCRGQFVDSMPVFPDDIRSLVMGNMMLAAYSLGIGSCWIHRAKEEFESEDGKKILKELGIDGEYEGIGHCILGYPDGEPGEAAPRKENRIYSY